MMVKNPILKKKLTEYVNKYKSDMIAYYTYFKEKIDDEWKEFEHSHDGEKLTFSQYLSCCSSMFYKQKFGAGIDYHSRKINLDEFKEFGIEFNESLDEEAFKGTYPLLHKLCDSCYNLLEIDDVTKVRVLLDHEDKACKPEIKYIEPFAIVKSVEEFLKLPMINDEFKELEITVGGDKKKCCDVFFRGATKNHPAIEPSAFRQSMRLKKENEYYKSAKKYASDEMGVLKDGFDNKLTFPYRLCRMQHYGMPTRMTDITSDPLFALYFACADTQIEGCINGAFSNRADAKPDPCSCVDRKFDDGVVYFWTGVFLKAKDVYAHSHAEFLSAFATLKEPQQKLVRDIFRYVLRLRDTIKFFLGELLDDIKHDCLEGNLGLGKKGGGGENLYKKGLDNICGKADKWANDVEKVIRDAVKAYVESDLKKMIDQLHLLASNKPPVEVNTQSYKEIFFNLVKYQRSLLDASLYGSISESEQIDKLFYKLLGVNDESSDFLKIEKKQLYGKLLFRFCDDCFFLPDYGLSGNKRLARQSGAMIINGIFAKHLAYEYKKILIPAESKCDILKELNERKVSGVGINYYSVYGDIFGQAKFDLECEREASERKLKK